MYGFANADELNFPRNVKKPIRDSLMIHQRETIRQNLAARHQSVHNCQLTKLLSAHRGSVMNYEYS